VKAIDIALKDLLRSLRSVTALIFMFGIPLVVTGMFYFMFGNIAQKGEFSLQRVRVVIANLDEGGPRLHLSGKNVPGDFQANTLGELVVEVLQSEDLAKLIEASLAPDAVSAKALVDQQQAGVAIIIPSDFSHQFTDVQGQAVLEFYQDPTLSLGPGIIRSILSQFMDGMAGVNIAADIAIEQIQGDDPSLVGVVVQRYTSSFFAQDDDLAQSMLTVSLPKADAEQDSNPLVALVGPIMGGMMIFYAFYTGTSSAESILREEEECTLPRLFTTPTSLTTILSGKLLAVFVTVLVQVATLLTAARIIFHIEWGNIFAVTIVAGGIICSASSTGIFINSCVKSTKQGGIIFGGVLTISGMVGMIRTFATNSPGVEKLSNSVSLLVPQGWAVKGLLQAMDGGGVQQVLFPTLVLLLWSAVFFIVGGYRFSRRYRLGT
jgi:ABC-2 type transport system permease protein